MREVNLPICHACLGAALFKCNGPCLCVADPYDIIRHASADYCPLGKFGGAKPERWDDAPPIPERLEIHINANGMTPEIARQQASAGGCCDPPKET